MESLFPWMMGEFIFESGEFPAQLNLEIGMHDIVANGVRNWLDFDFIRRKLFDGDCLIRHDADFIRHLRNLNLEPSDRFLLFRFENEIHYSRLLEISGISQEEFGRLIYLFQCFGLVHLVRSAVSYGEEPAAGAPKGQASRGPVPQEVQLPDAPRSTTDLGTYYAHCAIKSFEENNYWACVEYCRKAVEHKQDPGVYRLMGRALATHSKFHKEALDAYKKALTLSPNNAGIERDIADLYFDMGSFALARSKYEALLKQNPADQHSAKRLQEITKKKH